MSMLNLLESEKTMLVNYVRAPVVGFCFTACSCNIFPHI